MRIHPQKRNKKQYFKFIVRLAKKGWSLREIAEELGDISHTQINTDLVLAGYTKHKRDHNPTKRIMWKERKKRQYENVRI